MPAPTIPVSFVPNRPGSFARCIVVMLALWALVFSNSAVSARLTLSVVLSNGSAPYQEFAAALKSQTPAALKIKNYDTPETYLAEHVAGDMVIAVGMHAAEVLMAESRSPVLAVMVPQSGYEALVKNPSRHVSAVSAIYLNQPWERQIDFLFVALPDSHRVGVLHMAVPGQEVRQIASEVLRHGGVLVVQEVGTEPALSVSLNELLQGCDVLLALPDGTIYSAGNIRNILLSTYRHNVPLLGWSQAFVNAGAIAALYSSPEQLARQAVQMVLGYEQSGRLRAPQYPAEFNIAINRQVARALGIDIASEAEIRSHMREGGNRDE